MIFPKILVVSNNVFSDTTNNGKTLMSFFENYDPNRIAQLYFQDEVPTFKITKYFFQINDVDILKSILLMRKVCGRQVKAKGTRKNVKYKYFLNFINIIKDFQIIRLIREILWIFNTWKCPSLYQWLSKFSPDIIYFCAGDSGFAYEVVNWIRINFHCKLAVYITDDYVLPRSTLSIFWWIRRYYILQKMKKTIQNCSKLFVISPKMNNEYGKLFGRESTIIMNLSDDLRDPTIKRNGEILVLTYTGGFHFKRYEILRLLGQFINIYNSQYKEKKALLNIYSGTIPSKFILNKINIDGASRFCGSLNKEQLKETLNKSDILVFVESFDRKSIESTRLSLSSKIPEYLSVGKPILAIGPDEISSIQYLKDVAFCITDLKSFYSKLAKFLLDSELRKNLAEAGLRKYKMNHNKEKLRKMFMDHIIKLKYE